MTHTRAWAAGGRLSVAAGRQHRSLRVGTAGRTNVLLAWLTAVMTLAAWAMVQAPPARALGSDAVVAAPTFGADGVRGTIDTSGTDVGTHPLLSCAGGRPHAGGRWLRLRLPSTRLVRIEATPSTSTAVVSVHAITPEPGTEVICAAGTAPSQGRGPGTVVLEHVLAADIDYLVLVASVEAGDPQVDLRLTTADTSWRVGVPVPRRMHGAMLAATPRGIHLLGGVTRLMDTPGAPRDVVSDETWRWDRSAGRWQPTAPMPRGVTHSGAVALGTSIHVPGGRGATVRGQDCMVAAHQVLDVVRDRWSELPAPSGPVVFDAALVAEPGGGSFLRIGGAWDPTPCDTGSGFHDVNVTGQVLRYEREARRWVSLPPLGEPRQGAVAIAYGDYVIVAGGLARRTAVASTEVFDPRAGRWVRGAEMPIPSWGSVAALADGPEGRPVMVVAGGWTHQFGGASHGVVQVYDIVANTWSIDQRRMTAREAAGGTVHEGFLVTAGGWQGRPLRAVEVLQVDHTPPRVRLAAERRQQGMVVRVRAEDPSGPVRVRMRAGMGSWQATRTLRCRFEQGRCRVRVEARDPAGNVRRVDRTFRARR